MPQTNKLTEPVMPAAAGMAPLYLEDYPAEPEYVRKLIEKLNLDPVQRDRISERATALIQQIRQQPDSFSLLERFLSEYSLSRKEGVVMMCLAEALLRIPDNDTRERLIEGKINNADWDHHLGRSDSILVNASSFGLMLSGVLLERHEGGQGLSGILHELIGRLGEPLIREAMAAAMRILGDQFVLGETIGQALRRAEPYIESGYSFSFDMLGEAAVTQEESEQYYAAYRDAIDRVGLANRCEDITSAHSVSVKLSALHPRFEALHAEQVLPVIVERLLALCEICRDHGIGLTVDAEECSRLELTLEIFYGLLQHDRLAHWDGLGIAVQAYQKRALNVLRFLADAASRHHRRIMIRLVKGAYWDSEIKWSQEQGLDHYPVFTRKPFTDTSYLSCVRYLSRRPEQFYPMYATHNALTLCAVQEIAGDCDYEFQRLLGMGVSLYRQFMTDNRLDIPCRIYAPVGDHHHLLPYLVRRLLENGANTSFINRIHDQDIEPAQLAEDPVSRSIEILDTQETGLPLPRDLYGEERANSSGVDLSLSRVRNRLQSVLEELSRRQWQAGPIVNGQTVSGNERIVIYNPANFREKTGEVMLADEALTGRAFQSARAAASSWAGRPVEERAALLRRASDSLEQHRDELVSLLQREAGKTVEDAISEVREAVDFCRYYASQAIKLFSTPARLAGVTGENNTLACHARGVFVSISPWNFPVAIFTGQLAAALVTGNSVIAKPASATPLTACQVTRIFHQCGVPGDVLHFLPASSRVIRDALLRQKELAGVVFTGSIEVARDIQLVLASRESAITTLIAETGGINAMIVDSSALLEQVTRDVMRSAFNSAGQRCSAARMLYVQDEVAEPLTRKISGAMQELVAGNPQHMHTDIGPLINRQALEGLQEYEAWLRDHARLVYRCTLDKDCEKGYFLAPSMYEVHGIEVLPREAFGPILHVARFPGGQLDRVVQDINRTGYGLTLGLHSRIDHHIEHVCRHAKVGNIYVNRNQIGAMVGSQPFGGEGLSGTGPKAGGPDYLRRFVTERTITINTAAIGGNLELLT